MTIGSGFPPRGYRTGLEEPSFLFHMSAFGCGFFETASGQKYRPLSFRGFCHVIPTRKPPGPHPKGAVVSLERRRFCGSKPPYLPLKRTVPRLWTFGFLGCEARWPQEEGACKPRKPCLSSRGTVPFEQEDRAFRVGGPCLSSRGIVPFERFFS